MCLNASLAGLVAITAGCDVTDASGSIVIGAVAGLLVVSGVWFLDYKLRIDDPVGAVAVHCLNGIWGTIAVGLFATNTVPGYSIANSSGKELTGLFYGGGFELLGLQITGFAAVALWTAVTITIAFLIIKATIGIRAGREEEIAGLDISEHGLASAYDGVTFAPEPIYEDGVMMVSGNVPQAEAVEVKKIPTFTAGTDGVKMTKIEIVCREVKLEALKSAMMSIGITGMTVSHVLGCGVQKGKPEFYRGVAVEATLLPKIQVEIVVSKIPVASVIETAKRALYTGHIGDGKIFVYDIENVIKVRTGEEGYDALQDVE